MDSQDFLLGVIRPTLEILYREHPEIRYDESVERLLLGTAVQESMGLERLLQMGGGPALGLYQIEPDTHESIWDHYLAFRPNLASTIRGLASQKNFTDSNESLNNELITNMAYATAIARLVYLPAPEQIPDTLEGWAKYYKKHYNTDAGRATTADFIDNYERFVL